MKYLFPLVVVALFPLAYAHASVQPTCACRVQVGNYKAEWSTKLPLIHSSDPWEELNQCENPANGVLCRARCALFGTKRVYDRISHKFRTRFGSFFNGSKFGNSILTEDGRVVMRKYYDTVMPRGVSVVEGEQPGLCAVLRKDGISAQISDLEWESWTQNLQGLPMEPPRNKIIIDSHYRCGPPNQGVPNEGPMMRRVLYPGQIQQVLHYEPQPIPDLHRIGRFMTYRTLTDPAFCAGLVLTAGSFLLAKGALSECRYAAALPPLDSPKTEAEILKVKGKSLRSEPLPVKSFCGSDDKSQWCQNPDLKKRYEDTYQMNVQLFKEEGTAVSVLASYVRSATSLQVALENGGEGTAVHRMLADVSAHAQLLGQLEMCDEGSSCFYSKGTKEIGHCLFGEDESRCEKVEDSLPFLDQISYVTLKERIEKEQGQKLPQLQAPN